MIHNVSFTIPLEFVTWGGEKLPYPTLIKSIELRNPHHPNSYIPIEGLGHGVGGNCLIQYWTKKFSPSQSLYPHLGLGRITPWEGQGSTLGHFYPSRISKTFSSRLIASGWMGWCLTDSNEYLISRHQASWSKRQPFQIRMLHLTLS